MEIERKYLVHHIPFSLSDYTVKQIAQGYLCTHPVVRIRQSDSEFYLTYKGSGLLAREEYDLPLTREAYEHLVPKIDGILIQKKRYLIPLTQNLTAELDIFEGELAPLMLVEVEFATLEEANSFQPPDWFGEDVTMSGLYQNSRLSQRQFSDTSTLP